MNRCLPRQSLGIMAAELPRSLPFASSDYFRSLCLFGGKEGIEVFVFSPNRIEWEKESVTGYSYSKKSGEWVKKQFPLPALIYDRCFFASRDAYALYRCHMRKLCGRKDIRFLGKGLAGKWEVSQVLRRDPYFRSFLPETAQLSGKSTLLAWLTRKHEAILKPQGGSQGKGVLHVSLSREPSGYFELSGRDGRNRPVRMQFRKLSDLLQWLLPFLGGRPYIIQEYLSLHTGSGTAYDIRSLVQKDGDGHWQTTGMAVRCGKPGSVTSNLHGGGIAEEVMPFLTREFGAEKTIDLMHTLGELSARIPAALESAYGRLAELGIDIGIDRSARIWLLEVNSKPGRAVFQQLNNCPARQLSIESPIRYAGFLLKKKLVGG